MKINNNKLTRTINRFGVDCVVTVGAHTPKEVKAFISDFIGYNGRRSLSRYEATVSALGVVRRGDKIMYAQYDDLWDSDDNILVTVRGKQYEVMYDSVQYIGASPMYVWAILRPVRHVHSADYGDINDEYDEG